MGTHVSFILRGYNPYFEGLKTSFFKGFGVQRYLLSRKYTYLKGDIRISKTHHFWYPKLIFPQIPQVLGMIDFFHQMFIVSLCRKKLKMGGGLHTKLNISGISRFKRMK